MLFGEHGEGLGTTLRSNAQTPWCFSSWRMQFPLGFAWFVDASRKCYCDCVFAFVAGKSRRHVPRQSFPDFYCYCTAICHVTNST
jgi:hypothetical protein